MSNLRNKIFKFRVKLLYLTNSFKYLFIKGATVNIVSSAKYKNKIKEDLILQKYLLKEGYSSKIVAWEDNKYADVNIIRSVWGYHHDIDEFLSYINDIDTINDNKIIRENIDKKKQFELLEKNNISRIDTLFLDNISDYKYSSKKVVVKPVVSASGENTFVINKESDLNKVKKLNNIMIQPYISSISDGEISVIAINGKIKYAIKRFPGVFTEYKKEEYIPAFDLDKTIIDNVKKVISIDEYKKAVFMRVDFVKDGSDYKVMEVELVDPNLFIETISDLAVKDAVYTELVFSVKKLLDRNEE